MKRSLPTLQNVALRIIISVMLLAFAFISIPSVQAQQDTQGITLQPAFHLINADKGESVAINQLLVNNTAVDLKVTTHFYSIIFSKNPEESIQITKEIEGTSAEWLRMEEESSFILTSGEQKSIKIILDIPSEAAYKGYYPAVAFSFSKDTDTSELSLSEEIVSTIYLSVEPEETIQKTIYVNSFTPEKTVTFDNKMNFDVEIENASETHITPRGVIEIYSRRGIRQSELARVNDKLVTLLPGQILKEQVLWEDNLSSAGGTLKRLFPPVGEHTALLKVYIDNDLTDSVKIYKTFIVIPKQYIYYISGMVLLILGLSIYKRIKGVSTDTGNYTDTITFRAIGSF